MGPAGRRPSFKHLLSSAPRHYIPVPVLQWAREGQENPQRQGDIKGTSPRTSSLHGTPSLLPSTGDTTGTRPALHQRALSRRALTATTQPGRHTKPDGAFSLPGGLWAQVWRPWPLPPAPRSFSSLSVTSLRN